jgi:NDP-sugar pyrophosphorylase family protein
MEYYTPKIEEIFVGYKCEVTYCKTQEDIYWIPTILTLWDINTILEEKEGDFRTKYLDKEDIVNEGWKIDNEDSYKTYFVKRNEDIIYKLEFFKPNITPYVSLKDNCSIEDGKRIESVRYLGRSKSINEFRKIIEWTYQL